MTLKVPNQFFISFPINPVIIALDLASLSKIWERLLTLQVIVNDVK